MKKLSNPVVSVQLREFTETTTQFSKAIRWSSTAVMYQRSFDIVEHLCEIKEIENLILGPRITRGLKRPCDKFS